MADLFNVARIGDEVCMKVQSGFRRDQFVLRVGKIEKATATQIVAFGRRWRRSDGCEVSSADKWRRDWIVPLTPELQAEWAAMKALLAAENACARAADRLKFARGDEAIRLAAMLPAELTEKKDE